MRARTSLLDVLALLLHAAGALAQDPPAYWSRYDELRRELLAAGPERAAAGLWSDHTDAGLLWVHGFLTGVADPAAFEQWLAPHAVPTLELLHEVLWARPAIDRRQVLGRDLALVAMLKDAGMFDLAAGVLAVALPRITDPDLRLAFLLQAAEVHRRAYRWEHAETALEEAAPLAAGLPAAETTAAGVRLAVQRAALLLARGLPDLAVEHVQAAEQHAGNEVLRAQALFVRLRLEHALRRPDRAVREFQAFATPALEETAARDDEMHERMAQLRIRAALAVLADPEGDPPHGAAAVAWLRSTADDPRVSVDERLLARSVLVTHRLDRGDLHGVEDELRIATDELPPALPGRIDERRLALATLSLRSARLAGAAPEVLRERAAGVERLWRLLLERWSGLPASRVGEGPLFFGDSRRTLVELLRARRLLAGAAAGAEVLREVAAAQAVGTLARELGAHAPEPAAACAALCAPDRGALLYVPGHECSVLLVLTDSGPQVHLLEVGALGIDRRRQELLYHLQAARQGLEAAEFTAAARQCAAVLLPEVLAPLLAQWRALSVIGLESIGYLPFELLPGPDGRLLGLSHALSYLPSLPVGVWLATRPARNAGLGPGRVRILACPDAAPPDGLRETIQPLPFGDGEEALLRRAAGGTALELLRGSEAGAAAFLRPPDGTVLVQVLAHGVRDERRSDPQGLLLGTGEVLWPSTISRQGAAPCVLLTACRAGRGRLRRGDDGRHLLSGALLSAGARAVIAPVLDVGYRPSLEFAADVHEALWRHRLAPDEALRRARAAAHARGAADAWDASLYHLVGCGTVPLAPAAAARDEQRVLPVLGLVAAVLALACAIRRFRGRR